MVWNYQGPGTKKDQVRMLVGDTEPTVPLAQDEEIAWHLTRFRNIYRAAAEVADMISRRLARKPNIRTQDTTIEYVEMAKQYAQLAKDLRAQAALSSAMPFAGGISRSDKASRAADSDGVPPVFARNQGSYPGTASPWRGEEYC